MQTRICLLQFRDSLCREPATNSVIKKYVNIFGFFLPKFILIKKAIKEEPCCKGPLLRSSDRQVEQAGKTTYQLPFES